MALIVRSSQIQGRGCYTKTAIAAGRRIVEYTGPRLTVEQGDELYAGHEHTFLFGLEDGKTVIDGRGTAAFINHSCEPNCESEEIGGRVWIVALRDIAAGEELTYDYYLYEGEGHAPCRCGSNKCRGTLYSLEEIRRHRRRERRAQQKRKTGARKKPTAKRPRVAARPLKVQKRKAA